MTEATGAGVDVTVETVIRRSPADVATYANEPSNAPHWYAKISNAEWKTPPPLHVGTEIAFAARFLRRELRYTYEVVELTPSSLVMRTAQGPFPMETTYRYEATDDGHTRMSLRNRGNPSGLMRVMGPFMRIAVRRANTEDLKALKRLLEA